MKKNRKGFMLAEAVITSVIIATAMISFYTVFNKLYVSNIEKSRYYNIDGIYASKNTFNYLYNSNNLNKFINNVFYSAQYKIIMDDNSCFYLDKVYNVTVKAEKANYNKATMCHAIREQYKVNKMIMVEYDKSVLEIDLMAAPINQTFKDYIKYIAGYYDVSEHDTRYDYLILTEIEDGDNYYYGHIGIE